MIARNSMSKTVVILGAGASQDIGGPLMYDFLDHAESLLGTGVVDDAKTDFEVVFDGIHRLQATFAKSKFDIGNLEAVFVAFETAELLGRLGDKTFGVGKYSRALRRVIVRTLEEQIRFAVEGDNSNVIGSRSYDRLAEFVKAQHSKENGSVSIITFNYDYALDYSMAVKGVPVNYGLDASSRVGVDLLKLHGSLHWAKNSDQIFVAPISPMNAPGEKSIKLKLSTSALELASQPRPECDVETVIVPPSASKRHDQMRLHTVWRRAADALRDAEEIYISGYSLPATDEFFRYLFALGSISAKRLKRFIVFDKKAPPELDRRYKDLLGPMVLPRYGIVKLPFENFVEWLPKKDTEEWDKFIKFHAPKE